MRQGEHLGRWRFLGHVSVELFVVPVPFDGVQSRRFEVVVARHGDGAAYPHRLRDFDVHVGKGENPCNDKEG